MLCQNPAAPAYRNEIGAHLLDWNCKDQRPMHGENI